MGGRVGDDEVGKPASLDRKVVGWVTPAAESAHWVLVPDRGVLDVIGVERPVPVGRGALEAALGLEGLFELVGVPPVPWEEESGAAELAVQVDVEVDQVCSI